jgi:hypothetical protein
MRQNPIRHEATFIRFVCTALIVLGIALVNLSAVWAASPAAPPSWHDSGNLFPMRRVVARRLRCRCRSTLRPSAHVPARGRFGAVASPATVAAAFPSWRQHVPTRG